MRLYLGALLSVVAVLESINVLSAENEAESPLSSVPVQSAKREMGTTAAPNIVLIFLDALRADFTESYGATADTTPAIKKLSGEGATFLHVSSTSSFTRTAMGSALTSLLPWEHKIHGREGTLPTDVPYLPNSLKRLGYRTLGIIENSHMSAEFGFGRGFDHYHEMFRKSEGQAWRDAFSAGPKIFADHIWDTHLSEFLTVRNNDGPAFAYLHFIDPHAPYTPQPPYDKMYFRGIPPLNNASAATLDSMISGDIPATEENLAFLKSQYRGEISCLDAVVGQLMDRLDGSDMAENTLVVLTSDHGEEFWEHRGMHHWRTVYEEVLHVPMIFRMPGRIEAGKTIDFPASIIDFVPTVLHVAGLQTGDSWHGTDLFALEGDITEYAKQRRIYAGIRPYRDAIFRITARQDALKLIASLVDNTMTYELYNLQEDPGEKNNLWTERQKEVSHLFDDLRAILQSGIEQKYLEPETSEYEPTDAEIRMNMEAIGYL